MLRQRSAMSDELDIDPDDGVLLPVAHHDRARPASPAWRRWRKRLFIGLAHNAANPAAYFMLPDDRTVVMGSHIEL